MVQAVSGESYVRYGAVCMLWGELEGSQFISSGGRGCLKRGGGGVNVCFVELSCVEWSFVELMLWS